MIPRGAGRRPRRAALLLAGAATVFLSAEAIAAATWTGGHYSYARDVISALGVPASGAAPHSTSATLMNAGFIGYGVLFVVGYLLGIRPALARLRRTGCALAVTHGVGSVVVGCFPGGAVTASAHGVGAVMAIAGGNLMLLATGLGLHRRNRAVAVATVVLGASGLSAAAAMVVAGGTVVAPYAATAERVAVYCVMAGNYLAAGRLWRAGMKPRSAVLARGMADDIAPAGAELSPTDWVREQTERILAQGTTDGVEVQGRPVVLFTTTGAQSGKKRYVPLMRVEEDGRYAMVASKGGAPQHPSWYHNIVANPAVTVQDGEAVTTGSARRLEGAEREHWWELAVAAYPPYADYQTYTDRQIPVFVVE